METFASLLETATDPRLTHAAVVHFPVALSVLGVPVALAVAWRPDSVALRRACALVYAALALSALVAVTAGEEAQAAMGAVSLEGRAVIAEHARLARAVVWPSLLTAAGSVCLARARRPSIARTARLVVVAASLGTAALVGAVGHLGGTAVYRHGVGVPRPAATSPTETTDPRVTHFRDQVRPLLDRSCLGCHGPGRYAGGKLDMTSIDGLLRGGSRGPAVVPGRADDSLLIRVLSPADDLPLMPQGGKRLSDDDVEALRSWIDDGAVWSDE